MKNITVQNIDPERRCIGMIDRTYRDDPYEYMSQEPCDYCPYQNTDKCDEDNCKCMTYGIQEGKSGDCE